MTAKCDWGQCGRDATHQIGIKLWATVTPTLMRNDKNCISMISGIPICAECQGKVKAPDLLLPEGKERIATGMARAGAATPDFTSAKLFFVEILDKPIDPAAVANCARLTGSKVFEA